jgi:hypothetical protein
VSQDGLIRIPSAKPDSPTLAQVVEGLRVRVMGFSHYEDDEIGLSQADLRQRAIVRGYDALTDDLAKANLKATAYRAAIAEIAAKLDTGLTFNRDPVELIHAVQAIAKRAMGLTHIPANGGEDSDES